MSNSVVIRRSEMLAKVSIAVLNCLKIRDPREIIEKIGKTKEKCI